MNGLLVVVGIDPPTTDGTPPVRSVSGEFAFETITEAKPLRQPHRGSWAESGTVTYHCDSLVRNT